MPRFKPGDKVVNLQGNFEYEVLQVYPGNRLDLRTTTRLDGHGKATGGHVGNLWKDIPQSLVKRRADVA